MGWLDGQVILITGGGSGLGRALVTRVQNEGASVTVLERATDKAERLRQDCPGVVVTVGDVSSPSDCVRAVADASEAFGKLDCVIANAAIWDFGRPLREMPPDVLDRAFEEISGVNVKGVLLIASAALDQLVRSRGSLIVTLSGASFYPGGGGPNYVTSKHALVGTIKQLAYELAPDVRVNGVAAGVMSTDLRGPKALGQDTMVMTDVLRESDVPAHTALEKAISPEDYCAAFVLLAAENQSPTATGTIIDLSSKGVRGRRVHQDARPIVAGAPE